MPTSQHVYTQQTQFWSTERAYVLGDIARAAGHRLFAAQPGEVVLDAGCGAGLETIKLARTGARACGCDLSHEMIDAARNKSLQEKQDISFDVANIAEHLPYADAVFDGIFCNAVLIHDSPDECQRFIAEAARVMSKGGRLLISVMHPYLYQEGSPNRLNQASWAQYTPLEANPDLTQSCQFQEIYRNSAGKEFVSDVWYHPEPMFRAMMLQNGFCPVHEQNLCVTPEALSLANASGPYGYPAFYQIMATKL